MFLGVTLLEQLAYYYTYYFFTDGFVSFGRGEALVFDSLLVFFDSLAVRVDGADFWFNFDVFWESISWPLEVFLSVFAATVFSLPSTLFFAFYTLFDCLLVAYY